MNTDYESRRRLQRSNILFAFGIAILLYLAYHLRTELTIIYVSALIAVVLQPVARSIMRLHIGKWHPGIGLSVVILIVIIIAFFAGFIALAAPPAIHDLHNFVTELPTHAPRLLNRLKSLPFLRHLDVKTLNAKMQGDITGFASYAFSSAGNWVHAIFDFITGVLFTIYFMIEGGKVYTWGLKLVPIRHRGRLDGALIRAKARMGRWLLGQGTLMLILGVSSTIVFLILHIRYAYALGILMGLFNIIPVVGAMITVALAVLVAAIDSWSRVLGVLIFYAIYSQVEASILTPRIMQSRVNLPGIAILIALLIGGAIAGIAGAAVAVPTAVLISVLIEEYLIAGDSPLAIIAPTSSANME